MMMTRRAVLGAVTVLCTMSSAQEMNEPVEEIATRGAQAIVERLVSNGITGASAAIVLPGGKEVLVAAGFASEDEEVPLRTSDRLLSGSVGKTFVTAVANKLAAEGDLDLDVPFASYFEGENAAWLDRVPNARLATTRQLLRHTAGMPRYVFDPRFTPRLVDEIDKVWTPVELLEYVFDVEPLFAPGQGFAYADTHYVAVGLVIERVTGKAFYDLAQAHFVEPLMLRDSVPSNARRVPGLVQGHVVMGRQMGVPERTLADGMTTYNLQFEWCGGGWANTPRDLAHWAGALYGGEALGTEQLAVLLDAVDAPEFGSGVRYGLGVTIRETSHGELRSHDGFMPGYLTSIGHFPRENISVAIQLNKDDPRAVGKPLVDVLTELATVAREAAVTSK